MTAGFWLAPSSQPASIPERGDLIPLLSRDLSLQPAKTDFRLRVERLKMGREKLSSSRALLLLS